MTIKEYKLKDGTVLKLESNSKGFTLWSDNNWVIDASMLKETGAFGLCKKVKNSWGYQRFKTEVVKVKKGKRKLYNDEYKFIINKDYNN